jgi:hypothetical protein
MDTSSPYSDGSLVVECGMATVEMNYRMKKIQIRTSIISQEIYLLYVSCLFMLDNKGLFKNQVTKRSD